MEEKLLDALNHVDEKYIEEALPKVMFAKETEVTSRKLQSAAKKKQKAVYAWMKWPMAAACLCLVVYAGLRYQPGSGREPIGEATLSEDFTYLASGEAEDMSQESLQEEVPWVAEKHPILENIEINVWGGNGGGITLYDIAELETGNPLKIENLPEALPVYRNLSYYDGSGIPVYLKEEELLDLVEEAAEALKTTTTEVTYERLEDTSREYKGNTQVFNITANTEVATIEIEADGLGKVAFKEAVEVPPEYQLVGQHTSEKEEKELLYYLSDRFADLLNMEEAVVYSTCHYNNDGTLNRDYYAYEQGATELETFLNYHFAGARFSPAYEERNAVTYIWFGDKRRSAEYIKDYPLMSPEDAKKLLLSGQYFNYSDPKISEMGLRGGIITEPELTYRVYNSCKLYIPYFLFYAEIPQTNPEAESLGLKDYLSYYVPAIRQEYWDEMMDLLEEYF